MVSSGIFRCASCNTEGDVDERKISGAPGHYECAECGHRGPFGAKYQCNECQYMEWSAAPAWTCLHCTKNRPKRTSVIRALKPGGRWCELWFVEPWPDGLGYDVSCKQGKLWDLLHAGPDNLFAYVMCHGMVGLQLTFELRQPNWELLSIDGLAHPEDRAERVLCAALHIDDGKPRVHQPTETGIVFCGHRHNSIFSHPSYEDDGTTRVEGRRYQGFLTSKNRFIGREEARAIALDMGQAGGPLVTTEKPDELYSEDLY